MRSIVNLTHPAKNWEDGFPLGNGKIGAMIQGQVLNEIVPLNEETAYYGGAKKRHNPDARANVERIRDLLLKGEVEKAAYLTKASMTSAPKNLYPFVPSGNLRLTYYNQKPEVTDYCRSLDLDNAVAEVRYKTDGAEVVREYFTSLDANVLAIRISGTNPVTLMANISNRPYEQYTGKLDDKTVGTWGRFGEDGLNYISCARMTAEGGKLGITGDFLTVEDAKSVVIYVTVKTDYGNNSDYKVQALQELDKAESMGFDKLLQAHKAAYHNLYNRVSLSINDIENVSEPTDLLLENFKNGDHSDYLYALAFNMGRYLLISSSYNCLIPANLQGLWNGNFAPPWESVFTININTEMNYWPAEVCNLSECHLPLFNMIEKMRVSGRETAKLLYGCGGFVAHHNTDIWGDTAVVGIHDASYIWPMGGAWLALHMYEHYAYTQDENFLRERAMPVLRDALEFFNDYLYHDKDGMLLTGPSLSPENTFITKDGQRSAICMAPSMDSQIIWELCKSYLIGCDVLESVDFRAETEAIMNHLPPIQLTSDGCIREWLEDYDVVEPGHRHVSHLFALHPGTQITGEKPELMQAALKTIEKRLANGGGHTGWSGAWAVNFFARLKDGEKAYNQFNKFMAHSMLGNMLSVHPPFQIDGNFGATSGIAEMLVQSHEPVCELLPAIPNAWKTGRVRGFKLRGGVTVDFGWEDGKVKDAVFTSGKDIEIKVRVNGNVEILKLRSGESYELFR